MSSTTTSGSEGGGGPIGQLELKPRDDIEAPTAAAKDESKTDDPVQELMGSIGKWQLFTCFVIFMLKFPVAWHQMGIIFLAPPVDFSCIPPQDSPNIILDKCDPQCIGHEFNRSVFTETIATEFDLICEKSQLPNLSQTIFMLGILTGNVVFGSMADKYGRRNPLVIAVTIQLVFGVATSFASSFWLFCVLRFITAMATGGTMVTSFVITMEIIGKKYREVMSVVYQIPFNIGHFTLAIFGYFIRDWRTLQFALSIPSVLLLSYYWLVPESPRWLFTVGRLDEASKILTTAAKWNKLPTDKISSELEAASKLKGTTVHKGNAWDLVRTPNMRAKTLYMCFNWFICGLAFFGVAQYVGQTGGNIFVNVAFSAALELPGTLFCIYSMKKWGRKKTLIGSNCMTGVCMLLIAIVPRSNPLVGVILASLGIVGMSVSFPTVYLFAGELFPTVVRNIGIGSASTVARIGSMVAPFVAGLSSVAHWLPPVIFGIFPIVAAVFVVFLPETKGAPLPETMEDGENFGKKNKVDSVENGK